MGRDRVRQIVATAEAAGLRPCGPPLTREQWEALVPSLFAARLTPTPTGQRQLLAQFHDAIVEGLTTNTAQTVWQRLHDERGLEVSIRTFRRYVRDHVQGGRHGHRAASEHSRCERRRRRSSSGHWWSHRRRRRRHAVAPASGNTSEPIRCRIAGALKRARTALLYT